MKYISPKFVCTDQVITCSANTSHKPPTASHPMQMEMARCCTYRCPTSDQIIFTVFSFLAHCFLRFCQPSTKNSLICVTYSQCVCQPQIKGSYGLCIKNLYTPNIPDIFQYSILQTCSIHSLKEKSKPLKQR